MREHATIVFPAESHAEHEGTVVHPDGRVQRLRQAIARPGEVRAGLVDPAPSWPSACGVDARACSPAPMASTQLFAAVPFYAGLTLDAIGGKGLRWPADASAAARLARGRRCARRARRARAGRRASRTAACAWARYRSDLGRPRGRGLPRPAVPRARARGSSCRPHDAQRLGLFDGDKVTVGDGKGGAVDATVSLRAAIPAGSAFLEGNGVEGPLVDVRKRPATEPAGPNPSP